MNPTSQDLSAYFASLGRKGSTLRWANSKMTPEERSAMGKRMAEAKKLKKSREAAKIALDDNVAVTYYTV